MSIVAPAEASMWELPTDQRRTRMTDQEINDKYDLREKRIVTESNREKLPNFVDALKRPDYIDLQPFYQRRERWDPERQSRLIESFIINIPVPPLFLYEKAYNSYEVMDGQQRITALQAFYSNELQLTGLEIWPELNGKTYTKLPSKIKAGIDRRSIAYIVLLKESTDSEEEALLIKQLVFERLNTGGIKLGNQEIRNALYHGPLNALLLRLSRYHAFTQAWGVPPYSSEEEGRIPKDLADNRLFQTMDDAEIVLRFLALRHADKFRRGMNGFLDLYMIRARTFSESDICILESLFHDTIDLGLKIYGDLLFRPFVVSEQKWLNRPHKAFYDAVMVGLSERLNDAEPLITASLEIIEATKQLFINHDPGTFTGRGNTKADIQERIRLFRVMLDTIVPPSE